MIYLVLVYMLMGEFGAAAKPVETMAECEKAKASVMEQLKANEAEFKEAGYKLVSLRCEKV
jgi:hypothetical protein